MNDAGAVAPAPTRTKSSRGGFFRRAAPAINGFLQARSAFWAHNGLALNAPSR
jgi:hypothetical protein